VAPLGLVQLLVKEMCELMLKLEVGFLVLVMKNMILDMMWLIKPGGSRLAGYMI